MGIPLALQPAQVPAAGQIDLGRPSRHQHRRSATDFLESHVRYGDALTSAERDGYSALQVGFGEKAAHRATRPLVGHCRAAGKGTDLGPRDLR